MTQFVNLQSGQFRCDLSRAEDAVGWLVFSNSMLTDLGVWDHQIAPLAKRYNILRYDHRGHGQSVVSKADASIEDLAADVSGLLDHFAIEDCIYVGLSIGVPTGLAFYGRDPARVKALVLVDGQAKTAVGGAAGWDDRIETARSKGMGAIADATLPRWFSDRFIAAGLAKPLREMVVTTPVEGFARTAHALKDYDFEIVLPDIAVPVLLVVGANDGGLPETMMKMAEAIPSARCVVIDDAGHLSNVEQPEAFNRALLAFLQDIER